MKTAIFGGAIVLLSANLVNAIPLTESRFTEIVKNVEVIDQFSHAATPAKVRDLFKSPNLVRTGPGSRAELTAADQSITRVGANTVFSFSDSGREINLEQGCVLFHTPHGKGGGVIKSGGASAAVTGTTLIVAAVPSQKTNDNNGFKVILLEGSGTVKLKNGRSRTLNAGEMIYVLPGQRNFGPELTVNLTRLVAGSTLVHGYAGALPSLPQIQVASFNQSISRNYTSTERTADSFLNNDNSIPPGPPSLGGDPLFFQTGISTPVIKDVQNGGNNFNNLFNNTPGIPGQVQHSYTDQDGNVFTYYAPVNANPLNVNPQGGGSPGGGILGGGILGSSSGQFFIAPARSGAVVIAPPTVKK